MYVALFDFHHIIIFDSFIKGVFVTIARLTCVTHDSIKNSYDLCEMCVQIGIIFEFDFILVCINQTLFTQHVMF